MIQMRSDRMAEKKKILYVVESLGGGVFTYMVNLANELVNEFEMYIAYAARPELPADYKDHFDVRVHLIKVKNFCREINPGKDMNAVREVKQIAKNIKPDIIHLHSSKAGVIGRIAFNGKNVPLFYTPHGYSFLMQDYHPFMRMAFKSIEAVMAKTKCTTISCSPGEHRETLKLTRNAVYVNNAINTDELKEKLKDIKPQPHPFTVFTLGRICYAKTPGLFNEIAEKMPDTKFLWIGDGELRNELKSENIEITGWVDREEALKRSMNADVFVLTSLWEGLPMSLLEAMYLKKPCVVSNVIGNRDVIKNGENGFVCDSIDDYLYGIRNGSIEMIENAYQDLMENYDTKAQAERYARIYRRGTGTQYDNT